MVVDWHSFIHSDSAVLAGKPVVKGTRISVEFVLELFAAGWDREQVLANYPSLDAEKIQAVFAFATECIRDESIYVLPPG